MRFQVPQFIEVEDKIIGPFTLKQFIYLAGSLGICIVLYNFLPLFIAIIFMVPVAGLGVALAFYKVHNRPFIKIMEASFKYLTGNRLYIWKQQTKSPGKKEEEKSGLKQGEIIPRLSSSKLKELTWSLDIKEHPTEPPRDTEHEA